MQRFDAGLVRACHDLSEGGLAVALGGDGVCRVVWERWRNWGWKQDAVVDAVQRIEHAVCLRSCSGERGRVRSDDCPTYRSRESARVTDSGKLSITCASVPVIDADIRTLKEAWQAPLRW